MRLLDNGIGVQSKQWVVNEKQSAGFSRIYYIISGEVTYSDNYITKKLLKEKLYIFPAQHPYRITHNPDKPIECLWLHIDFFPYDIDRILEINVHSDCNITLSALITALSNEGKFFKDNDSLYESLAQSLALCIVKHPAIKNIDSSIAVILSYIRENLFSPTLNVINISEHFGYSTSHFIRMFKMSMNTTPHRYITVLRMSSATKLLLEGASIFETAYLCGYTDVKNFSRVFKNNFSVPPSKYSRYYRPKA